VFVYNFDPEDAASREALQRLVEWVIQFLGPEKALAAAGEGLKFTESRPLGGAWALDALWNRLGVGASMRRLLTGHGLDDSAERVLFALVANRALAPSPTPAAARWVNEDVYISGLPATTDDACYRAADWLLEIREALEREIFDRVAGPPNREVELLFFGATAACPCGDQDDEPVARGKHARGNPADADGANSRTAWLRAYDSSADRHGYPPQAVIGVAVTRDGIPVRTWCWQRTTAEPALIRQVMDDMRDFAPSQIAWVADRGFTSAEDRRYLRGNGNYIIGEKLRSGSAEATAALSRQGRYQAVTANLRIKEVRVSDDERFIICHDPERAARDAAVRARTLAELEEFIQHTDKHSRDRQAEACGVIAVGPGLNRYLRVTPGGRLRIHAKAVKAEENLDGKYLLRASDPEMTAEDIALGYTRLLEVERGWRTMNQFIEPRSAYHRDEERAQAHVMLYWLALLLARVAENACHTAWPKLRRELDRIAVGTFTGPAGTFRQRTEITETQREIFTQLGIDPPPRIYQPTPAT
jgi:hypothetical protein